MILLPATDTLVSICSLAYSFSKVDIGQSFSLRFTNTYCKFPFSLLLSFPLIDFHII